MRGPVGMARKQLYYQARVAEGVTRDEERDVGVDRRRSFGS